MTDAAWTWAPLKLVARLGTGHTPSQSCLETCERLDRQIALLQERRQALITAAVTGQMEIPGVAA